MPITESSDPLQLDEELYRECNLGLDREIVAYILESHALQIRIGGEPFHLYQRMTSGSIVTGTILSWDQTSPQYMKIMWSPGNSNHPDLRSYTGSGSGTFQAYENGVLLTRVLSQSDILYNNEFTLERIVGTGVSTKRQVRLWLNSGYTPGTITYSYNVRCECVSPDTNQPDMNCVICYGTGFPVGWIKYTCDADEYKPQNTIIVRVPKTSFRITFDSEGLVKREVNKHWTLSSPYVYNYDLIVGTIGKNKEMVYEVVNKTDSYFRGIFLHQEFETILLEETDVRYRRVATL